ncbi:MAG: helix-turn-helix transcriptional regulator [Planctomycetaceae bacterium]|nr:helix-turn-helix transcriptional regulator [Planctomycetaceae bacterium]
MAIPEFPPSKVRPIREANGWTQEELAERIGVTRSLVTHWESGIRTPTGPAAILLHDLASSTSGKKISRNRVDRPNDTR